MGKVFNSRLMRIIRKKNIICFDVFDTLIKRNCAKPTDIFKIVEARYNKGSQEKITDFFYERIKAEKQAKMLTDKEEITFEEIYGYMPYSEKIKNSLKKIEIQTELQYCQPNYEMKKIYEYCKKINKKIVCISDMYLPTEVISKILIKNGYEIDYIYLSSQYECKKTTGNLFRKMLVEMNVTRRECLHIGDSYKADLLGALKAGIKAYHIPKRVNNSRYVLYPKMKQKSVKYSLSSSIALSVINNNVKKIEDKYEKMGYEIIGPICCSFSYWIKRTAQDNNLSKLLFCARDMALIYDVYSKLFENEISCDYFFVSRKSTYLPYLYLNSDFDSFKALMPNGKRKISIVELLDMFNIKIENIEEKLASYNLNKDMKYDSEMWKENENLKSFYEKYIKEYIKSEGEKQYIFFNKYLTNLGAEEDVAIVDLGWRGTTQKIMMDITKHNVNGLYLGLYQKNENYLKDNYWTYLFDGKENVYINRIYSFITLFELFFSGLHGTTIAYNDDQRPWILKESINKDNEKIAKIQEGARVYCEDILNYKDDVDLSDSVMFVEELINICINPKLSDAVGFGDICTENLNIRNFAKPQKISSYIKNMKSLKQDFLDSEWKIGFMKRLFKIKLPYFKIYKYLREKFLEEKK